MALVDNVHILVYTDTNFINLSSLNQAIKSDKRKTRYHHVASKTEISVC